MTDKAATPVRSGKPLIEAIRAVRCIECGFVSPTPPDDDLECCWKGPNWQHVLIVPAGQEITDGPSPGVGS